MKKRRPNPISAAKTRSILKKRRRRKLWEKNKNIARNNRRSSYIYRQATQRPIPAYSSPIVVKLRIPSDFSIISNKDEVLKFFDKCKKYNKTICDELFFDFADIHNVGLGAVTILESICGYVHDNGVRVSGSYPKDGHVRDMFEKSGFLKKYKARYQNSENQFSKNEIIERGLDRTNQSASARKIREAMQTVWNVDAPNPRLQGMMIELMANTVNHAYEKKQKGWYMSVDHDKENKRVKFCFVDNGQGILQTVKLKNWDKFASFFKQSSNSHILKEAFDGKFGSRTQLSHRGRGLPLIKKNSDQNIIKNLTVISNDVYVNFASQTTEVLNTDFDGTFYYWELDTTCKSKYNGTQNIGS